MSKQGRREATRRWDKAVGKAMRAVTLWLWGGFLYYAIELAWRGYSHPSMFIVGGLCFALIGAINNAFPWSPGLAWQALLGAVAVTAVELVSGLYLNIWCGLGIWDYSQMPFNLAGQICLQYALLWVPLSVAGVWLDDYLRYFLFSEQRPQYKIF